MPTKVYKIDDHTPLTASDLQRILKDLDSDRYVLVEYHDVAEVRVDDYVVTLVLRRRNT